MVQGPEANAESFAHGVEGLAEVLAMRLLEAHERDAGDQLAVSGVPRRTRAFIGITRATMGLVAVLP